MCKFWWADSKMSSLDVIDQAARWSRGLAQMRSRGPGDLDNAMRAIEREYDIAYWFQWKLRYRRSRLRDIGYIALMKLRAAYEAECARQERRFSHEREIAKRVDGSNPALVRESEALVEHPPEASDVSASFWEE